MAGAACKVIINQLLWGLGKGLETALTMPMIRERLGEDVADKLLDRMVRVDLAQYDGSWAQDSLASVLDELVDAGIVTDEVWRILRKPRE